MKNISKTNINLFVEELETRINVLKSSSLTANIDNSNYKDLSKLTNKHLSKSPEDITEEDLKSLNASVIKELLILSDEKKDSVDYLVSRLDDYDRFYTTIKNIIVTYAKEYLSIDDNQNEILMSKINTYQKYIDLFKKGKSDEVLDDQKELILILETGFDDEIKKDVLLEFARINDEIVDPKISRITALIDEAYESVSDFITYPEIMESIEEKLSLTVIDPDIIPTIAERMSYEINVDKYIVNNIICVIVAKKLFQEYMDFNKQERKEYGYYIDAIKDTLSLMVKLHNNIYYKCVDIIKENGIDKLSIEGELKDDDVYEIVDTPISLLDMDSYDEAINVKEYSVLKPMLDTINSIDSIDIDSEEYNNYINLLKKLFDQYYVFEHKKEENIRIK